MTYGGMSVREIEAMTVGFEESMDMNIISQGPQFVGYCVKNLDDFLEQGRIQDRHDAVFFADARGGLHVGVGNGLPTRAGPARTSWPPGSSSRETASS